jgi:hypothetical protein
MVLRTNVNISLYNVSPWDLMRHEKSLSTLTKKIYCQYPIFTHQSPKRILIAIRFQVQLRSPRDIPGVVKPQPDQGNILR